MRAAALYVRQSLDRTGEALAVTRQREDCERLAADRGWQVTQVFSDNDTSASNGRPRAGYARLCEAIRAGQVDAVAVWSADRLHRRPAELEEFIALADQHGTALATVSGELDLGTPAGRLVARLLGAVARNEVEQKGARQQRANLQAAQAGRMRHSRRPYGYEDDGRTVRPAEAGHVRDAARRVLAGATLSEVVASMNRGDIPTSTGGRWTITQLKRVLTNPRYAGLATYRREIVAAGDWPVILDEGIHQALVGHLTDPARRTATSTARKYLLSGLAVCGRCGETMFASPMGVKGEYRMVYRCRTSHLARRLDLVDEVVTEIVIGRLAMPDAIGLLIDDNRPDAEELRQEALGLRSRLDQLAVVFADGAITTVQLRTATERLRSRLKAVEARQADTSRPQVLAALVGVQDVRAAWDQLSLGERRAVIDTLMTVTILPAGKGIRFRPEHVRIDWRQS